MISIKKILYVILGSITLTLGIIGIILPIIPTTPFLLLSAYFYIRSSKKLYDWLINNKILGPYIKNYIIHKALPKRTKIWAIVMIVISITITVILINNLIVYIILPIIAFIVCIYILSLKTLELHDEDRQ